MLFLRLLPLRGLVSVRWWYGKTFWCRGEMMFARMVSVEVGFRCVSAEDAQPRPVAVRLRRRCVHLVAARSVLHTSNGWMGDASVASAASTLLLPAGSQSSVGDVPATSTLQGNARRGLPQHRRIWNLVLLLSLLLMCLLALRRGGAPMLRQSQLLPLVIACPVLVSAATLPCPLSRSFLLR